MPKFNTGNPVGSSDPRDLFDNAVVTDNLLTGAGAAYNDRLGKSRKSWQGMEDEFAAFIAASGYEFVGDYAAGIEITGYNQIVRDASGEFWRLSGPIALPYTTTGAGLPEGGSFVAVGDAVLRQDLESAAQGKGASLISVPGTSKKVDQALAERVQNFTENDGSGRQVPGPEHYSYYDLRTLTRAKPPGLEWLPFDVLGFQAGGNVAISKAPLQIKDAVVTLPNLDTTHHIDPLIGSDTDAGNQSQPFASINHFLTIGSYIAKLSVGNYDRFDIRRDQTSGNRVRSFIGSGNVRTDWLDASKKTIVRIPGDTAQEATWTIGSTDNVNETVLNTDNVPIAVTMGRITDETGRPKPLRKQATAADVAANGGWHYDAASKTLSVRYGRVTEFDANIKPELDIIYKDAAGGRVLLEGAEAYFENILFVGCHPWLLNGLGTPIAVFNNCGFWFSSTAGVLNDGGYAYLIDCEIYRCKGDGVGSHVANGVEARHVAVNCDVLYAGDIDTYGEGDSNQNGLSMHENGDAAVLGGTIRKSSGPNLIDTGSGAGSTGVSWWLGVHCEQSLGSNRTNFETYGVRTVWMESCSENGDASSPVVVTGTGTLLRSSANSVRGYTPGSGGEKVDYAVDNL